MTNTLTAHGYQTGDRVHDVATRMHGTVRAWELDEEDRERYALGEVGWDGSFVADELDDELAARLVLCGCGR